MAENELAKRYNSWVDKELEKKVKGEKTAGNANNSRRKKYLDWLKCAPAGTQIVQRGAADYPEQLREVVGAPEFLMVRGDISLLQAERMIAVVGTRRATTYAREVALALSRELSRAGVTIVSGFARGIDGAAHRGALEAAGGTIAVLGTGIDVAYPAAHCRLREQLLAGRGLLLTSFLPGTRPYPGNFPQRNVMISGLAAGVVVVEAPLQSGAVITANLAADQGREVWVVPGRIGAPNEGGHRLIKDGAGLVECAADILGELGWPSCCVASVGAMPTVAEQRIMEALLREQHIDAVSESLSGGSGDIAGALTRLELAGWVSRRPGRRFVISELGRKVLARAKDER